jgi:hypothetical protein
MTSRLLGFAVVALAAGCDDLHVQLPTPEAGTAPVTMGTRFDPATVGVVRGSVTWVGDRPTVPPLRVCRITATGPQWLAVPNPNAPRITPAGGLAGAVVFLRGIDPAAAAPWPHPPVTVEADDTRISIHPFGRTGFTPVGSEVEFRSASDSLLGVRAREAAFFTLMLPERTSVRRRLDRAGRVELTSPAYLYWQVADLFVCDHPYYAHTDDHGRFRFENVPAGEYRVVCWLPHWETDSTERDPETGADFRAKYHDSGEESVPVRSQPGRVSDVGISVSLASFIPPEPR